MHELLPEAVQLKAVSIETVTLVYYTYSNDEFPRPGGNCFTVTADDGNFYRIVNFNHENLVELQRRGVNLPFGIVKLGHHTAVLHDLRVPDDWYDERFCSVCCPEALLPLPQRLQIIRAEQSGRRTAVTSGDVKIITYSIGKGPKV